MTNEKSTRIRELNDSFRTTGIGGTVVMTRGVSELDQITILMITKAVQMFDEFHTGQRSLRRA